MLVSCIMPTANRRRFVPRAIGCFLAQDHADKELIILDDGEDAVADLVPDHPQIRYVREGARRLVGAKRNALCDLAQGDVIVHWDDDDWSATQRLRLQLEVLTRAGADACGLSQVLFLADDGRAAWEFCYPSGGAPWVYGASLCYTKAFWRRNRFPEIAMGEDTRFVWADSRARIEAMADNRFLVAMVHPANTSPKRVRDPAWRPYSPDAILALMAGQGVAPAAVAAPGPRCTPSPGVTPLRNVYACLVHESHECVLDLVRNLRHLDSESRILLYDGSAGGDLLDMRLPWSRWGVEICRERRPMTWGKLHGFALDCIRCLRSSELFDVMTIVDSDQLALRAGYSEFLARRLGNRAGLGLLSSAPERQGPNTRNAPSLAAHAEGQLWRPLLGRFPDGESKFVHWTFWPGTVITAEAGFALLDLFDKDDELHRILAASRMWATEEVLFPTLTALLGFRVERNPCTYDYVKYRAPYTARDLQSALQRSDAYWMHPVPRICDHPLRMSIRQRHGDYSMKREESVGQPHPDQLWPLLRTMRSIEGWLDDEEAELLAIAAREAVTRGPESKIIVEVGSYCGKATFLLASIAKMHAADARVIAVDTFDGVVGARDRGLVRKGPTLQKFMRMLDENSLEPWVELRVGRAPALAWNNDIALLLIDGLHDYAAVAQDFYAFDTCLPSGALVAFHDYSDHFPGVRAFVNELLGDASWQQMAQAGSMILLRRVEVAPFADTSDRLPPQQLAAGAVLGPA